MVEGNIGYLSLQLSSIFNTFNFIPGNCLFSEKGLAEKSFL